MTCLEQSPALDTVAVGLGNGRVVIQNVRVDRTVVDFTHDGSGRAIRSMSFTTATRTRSSRWAATPGPSASGTWRSGA